MRLQGNIERISYGVPDQTRTGIIPIMHSEFRKLGHYEN